MKRILPVILLLAALPVAAAQTIPSCPSPLSWTTEESALNALTALNNAEVERNIEKDKCEPKINTTMVFGSPLCLFAGAVPVIGAAIASGTDGQLASVLYMFDYSPTQSDKAVAALSSQYQKLPSGFYAANRHVAAHTQVNAMFDAGDSFVVVIDPSSDPYNRVPGQNWSVMEFTKKPFFAIAGRDLNSCQ